MYDEGIVEKGKSHNIFNKHIDDTTLVKQFGLDPKVAYTPKINSAIVNAQHRLNYNEYIKGGETPKNAMKFANAERSAAHQRVSRDLKLRKEQGL